MAASLKDLREIRKMKQQDLSARLGELGHPMSASAISKIEAGDRRVDVDDLVALAVALEVHPTRLMLPVDDSDVDVSLTPTTTVSAARAWDWMNGSRAAAADL